MEATAASSDPLIIVKDAILTEELHRCSFEKKPCNLYLTTTQLVICNTKNVHIYDIRLEGVVGARYRVAKKDKHALDIFAYNKGRPGCCCSDVDREREELSLVFESLELCTTWKNAINCTIRRLPLVKDEAGLYQAPPPRHVLVYINPFGGQRLSPSIWTETTRPMLDEAGVTYDLLMTERANHAKEDVSTKDLSNVDAILIISGDGLIFEIVNGLASRENGDDILRRMPIAPIPGGTGNGLIKSILHECNEEYSPLCATFVAIKGVPSPLDMSTVTTPHENHRAFLILGWGLISDIDILSENMRWLGEFRYDIAAVSRIIQKKYYAGKLSMLLKSTLESGETPLIPDINSPIAEDSGWTVIEGDFIFVWILQTSHCSASIYSAPGASLDDGVFTIIVGRTFSRWEMLQVLLSIDTGSHMDNPRCEVYKAHAYRLEPATTEGIYTLDGEVVEYGPIQGVVNPAALRILKLAAPEE